MVNCLSRDNIVSHETMIDMKGIRGEKVQQEINICGASTTFLSIVVQKSNSLPRLVVTANKQG